MGAPVQSDEIKTIAHAKHMRPFLWGRVILHVGMGLFCLWVALEFLTSFQELICTGLIFASLALIEGLRFNISTFNDWILNVGSVLAHRHEENRITSATWFWTAIFPVSLIQSELVLALTLAVLSLGDQAGSFVGRRFGTITLHNGRSLQGTLAFIFSSAILCWVMLTTYFPGLSAQETFWLSLVPPMSGGLTELFCSKIDDNFGVGIATGLITWATTCLLDLY